MKKFTLLFLFLTALIGCEKNYEEEFEPQKGNILKIKLSGDYIEVSENKLTKSTSQKDIFMFQVYHCDANSDDYTPYANGIFDDLSNLYFNTKLGYKYKIVATAVLNANNTLSVDNEDYGKPFEGAVTNTFTLSSSENTNVISGNAESIDGVEYQLPCVDRYYGEATDINPTESSSVSLFLKRMVFGIRYIVKGVPDGQIKVKIGDSPLLNISPETQTLDAIYTLNNIKAAWEANESEEKYSENYELQIYQDNQLKKSQTITVKRKTLTTVTYTTGGGAEDIDIQLEDSYLYTDAIITEDQQYLGTVIIKTEDDIKSINNKGYKYIQTLELYGDDISDFSGLNHITSVGILHLYNFKDKEYKPLNFRSLSSLCICDSHFKDMGILLDKNISALTFDNSIIESLKGISTNGDMTLTISNNSIVHSFEGLSNVEIINNISITSSHIKTFAGLESVKSINYFSVNSSSIDSYQGLHNLKHVGNLLFNYYLGEEISFPYLETISSFNISKTYDSNKSYKLSFPVLKSIESGLSIDSEDLKISDPFENLEKIGGAFYYTGNYQTNFDTKFPKLKEVGSLRVYNSSITLDEMDLLPALELVKGDLEINNISSRLIKFPSLQSVEGNVNYSSCPYLQGFDGMINLTNIYGNLTISSSAIPNMHGFDNLQQINGKLSISNCDMLVNLSDLNSVNRIEKGLELSNCKKIHTISGLNNLSYLGGLKVFEYYNYFESITGLTSLGRIDGDVEIKSNGLTSVIGLSKLSTITGSISLTSDDLVWMSDLSLLQTLGGSLLISGQNPDLSIFSNLTSINGNVSITSANLNSLIGLDNVISINGSLYLELREMVSMNSMSKLSRIEKAITFYNCNDAIDLHPLTTLEYIGGDVVINQCNSLRALPTVKSNLSIKGYLLVEDNDDLNSVAGIANANSIGRLISFVNNPNVYDFSAYSKFMNHEHEFYARGNGSNPDKNSL